MINKKRFHEISSQFKNKRIAIVGDFFLDKYLFFDTNSQEVSVETNKIANQVVKIKHSPGAAGNILSNLKALETGTVIPIGFTGDDGEGYELRSDIKNLGCDDQYLIYVKERQTPTYMKPQNINIIGLSGENERYDIKNRTAFPEYAQDLIISLLDKIIPTVDGVIIADQVEVETPNCGVITDKVREKLIDLAKEDPNIIFWVDSRLRLSKFTHMILKPNKEEAVKNALGKDTEITEENVILAGKTLCKQSQRPVFITRSEEGIWIFNKSDIQKVPAITEPGEIDPTGAGDSATSGAVLSLCSNASQIEAAYIGNLTASITVKKLGTTGTASIAEIAQKLKD